MEAQFGLLDVGMTARARREKAPCFMSWSKWGVCALRIPSGLKPSTPMMTAREGRAVKARHEAATMIAVANGRLILNVSLWGRRDFSIARFRGKTASARASRLGVNLGKEMLRRISTGVAGF